MECRRCKGSGLVLVRLHRLGLGEGGTKLLSAGLRAVYDGDGHGEYLGHEMVCAHCDGSGKAVAKCSQ